LSAWVRTITSNDWLLVLGFFVVFGSIAFILELLLDYYSGFTLPHRFGLYLASLALNWASGYFSFSGPGDIAGLPAMGILIGAFGLGTQPLGNLVSRWRERLSDDYSLQSVGVGEILVGWQPEGGINENSNV
jgi:Zn-dependent protease with chaperone function